MNTLIDIALTIQPLKARHSPQWSCFVSLGRGHVCRHLRSHMETRTHPQQQKSLQLVRTFRSTYPLTFS